MWGLFVLMVLGIGVFINSCKNDIEDNHSKQNAKNANQSYYLDWQGKKRSVENGHRILQYVTDHRTGDKVDLDMKTNEVLRNYSQEERLKKKNEESEWAMENKAAKEKAIKDGQYFYLSKEHRHDPHIGVLPWEHFYRRVSDDLLILKDDKVVDYYEKSSYKKYRSVCVDAKYKFRLYECGGENRTNRRYLLDDDRYNRSTCRYWASKDNINMTETELMEYAKSIGAIFVEETKNE